MQKPARKSRDAAGPGGDSETRRLKLRAAFFQRISLCDLLRPFDDIPGILYIVKDRESRVMAISSESVQRMGYEREEDVIGRSPHEYLSKELADKFRADDQWVLTHDKPRQNMVEMWYDSQGRRDWIVTSKYPLHDARGRLVGVIAILQNLGIRLQRLAYLGPVGKAADYIHAHLGGTLRVPDIARRVGFSERQLQRLFRRVFGRTVQQYIIATRVHAATHELTHSNRSIAEIAVMFGFSDQSAFSNTFRSVVGSSPGAYRQRLAS